MPSKDIARYGYPCRSGPPERTTDFDGTGAGYIFRSLCGVGYAVRGWYLYSFAIVARACLDDGSHRGGLPNLRPKRNGEEDRHHAYIPNVYTADDGASRSSQTNLQTRTTFYCLGGAVTETPDMSVEIARWTPAHWMRRSYLHELYD